MTEIDVVPAGDRLYEIELSDATGVSRHEVGLPDLLLERLDLDDVSASEVIVAAVELLLDREGREQLDREIDLAAAIDRYDGLGEQIPRRVRERADAAPPSFDTPPADSPSSDDRLVDQVEQEQRTGQASSPDRHL